MEISENHLEFWHTYTVMLFAADHFELIPMFYFILFIYIDSLQNQAHI